MFGKHLEHSECHSSSQVPPSSHPLNCCVGNPSLWVPGSLGVLSVRSLNGAQPLAQSWGPAPYVHFLGAALKSNAPF